MRYHLPKPNSIRVIREPSLDDLLREPIIMMMMACDDVTEEDVRQLVGRAKEGRRTIGVTWQAA